MDHTILNLPHSHPSFPTSPYKRFLYLVHSCSQKTISSQFELFECAAEGSEISKEANNFISIELFPLVTRNPIKIQVLGLHELINKYEIILQYSTDS